MIFSDPTLGVIEFSLLYDSHNQALHCTVHNAKVNKDNLIVIKLVGY